MDNRKVFGRSGDLERKATFTRYRWKNRFRLLSREHWINSVLYLEFSRKSMGSTALLEVVGRDGAEDFTDLIAEAREDKKRGMELN